ncbi:MAG TPA: DUF1508 domain-containing protein [Fimbriiglobus sp.]
MFTRRVFFAVLAAAATTGLAAADDGKMTFEIYTDKSNEFRWRLKDGDKSLATSGQGYAKKADCKKMCDNFVKDISKYTFEVYESKDGYRWRLNAKNGNNVGSSSGGFKTKADAQKAADAIKAGAKNAKVVDTTAKK